MNKRKIIQIAVTPETKENYALLMALCDDGTVWALPDNPENYVWKQLPPIPQDPDKCVVPPPGRQ